ncbi:MAG TPA: SPOR domain-containing protein [Gammaproteobacteria bacterium]|jgi:cell division septation protein DedD|nr:SPOR domain-containing protein [Gammaproteobacteria bacterium]
MQKKTKHRLLGIFVVLGLVIIAFPLLENEKDFSSGLTVVKAPPFPDQAVQVSAAESEANEQNTGSAKPENKAQPIEDKPAPVTSALVTPVTPNIAAIDEAITSPSVIQPSQAVIPIAGSSDQQAENTKATPALIDETLSAPVAVTQQQNTIKFKPEKKVQQIASNTNNSKTKTTAKTTNAIKMIKPTRVIATSTTVENGLVNLKSSAWVIQLGNFKNKANALRLVNQLRANGYRAFTQQISTTFGYSTRVFVGPEQEQGAARELADRLSDEMKLQGIVISYKPLSL